MLSTTALAVWSSVTSSPAARPRKTATIGATFLSPDDTAIRRGTLASSSSVSATRQSFDRCSQGRPLRSTRWARSSPSAPARSSAVLSACWVRPDEGNFDRLASARAVELAIAGPNDETPQPGVEPIGLADSANVEPRRDERVLEGIGRQLVVAQDQPREPVQPLARGRGELRECLAITGPRPEDEIEVQGWCSK